MRLSSLLLSASLVLVSACGGSSDNGTGSFLVPQNNAPIVASPNADQTGQVGIDFTYDATQGGTTFSDADGQNLTYTVAFEPSSNGLSASNGVITGMPEDTGVITVTITASDGFDISNDVLTITIGAEQDAIQAKFGGNIDLENLLDYETASAPDYFRASNPLVNPVTDKGATLGRAIFYDRSLSVTGFLACATCHVQSNAFTDAAGTETSQGTFGAFTRRSSMRLVNTRYGEEERFFWDERAENMEDQVTKPFKDHGEHGFSGQMGRPDFDDMIAQMQDDEAYQEFFRFVFLDETITEERIQSALSQFVHSIVSFDSKFDAGRAQVDNDRDPFPNFTDDENAGKNLFLGPMGTNGGGVGCSRCHVPPEFAIRTEMGTNGVVGEASDDDAFDFTNTRAPSLRDVVNADGTPHSSFMHDGSLETLRDVLDHYDNIPVPADDPERTQFLNTIDSRLMSMGSPRALNLSETEKDQLIAFLGTLTGSDIYTNEKWSDPN